MVRARGKGSQQYLRRKHPTAKTLFFISVLSCLTKDPNVMHLTLEPHQS